MKKIILFFVVALLFSINGMAQTEQTTQTPTGDVQVILKSQNLGLDKNFGVYRANINITMNKIGNLTYRESFYYVSYSSDGVAGQKTLFRTNSYDVAMKDYSASFGVTRPGLKSERDAWNTIIATVILDKNVVYETQISQSGTYKSFTTGKLTWVNDSSVAIGKTRPVIEKKPGPAFTATVEETNNTNEQTNSVTDVNIPKKAPMLETSVIIISILSIYILMRNNRRR